MPRQNRNNYDNGIYHIITRGNNKIKLFRKEEDFQACLNIIKRYKKRFEFCIYHYCLMPNHIHILLKIVKGKELPKLMHGINLTYNNYYKKECEHTGHLYENRYKSLLIEDDSYLTECGRYIERNPLRVGMVKELSDYPWSSYNFYAHGEKDNLITPDPCYLELSKRKDKRRRLYREYILQPRPYEKSLDSMLKLQL